MKEGAALPVDQHITLLNHNSTLQLSHIQVDHTGRYTCVAWNQAGEARRHFNLKVLGEEKRQKREADNSTQSETRTGIWGDIGCSLNKTADGRNKNKLIIRGEFVPIVPSDSSLNIVLWLQL